MDIKPRGKKKIDNKVITKTNKKITKSSINTKFFFDGDTVSVFSINDATSSNTLSPKVYSVAWNEIRGFFLITLKDKMEVPDIVYGVKNRVAKVKNTFENRDNSTGILLTGIKGAGKTMFSSVLCNEMIDSGYPIIIVNAPFSGDAFVNFIDSIGECVLLFDEFGKIYKEKNNNNETANQDALLTLMDGVSKQKRLVILTENEVKLINDFMLDRPGRIFYHFKYDKLDESSIKSYCKEHKVSKVPRKDIIEISRKMTGFSFDILQSIVEEHLRYKDENIEDLINDLNISFGGIKDIRVEVKKMVHNISNKEIKVNLVSMYTDVPTSKNYQFYVDTEYFGDSTNQTTNDFDDEYDESETDNDRKNMYTYFTYSSDLRYEKGKTLVFDNGTYTLITEVVPSFDNKFLY